MGGTRAGESGSGTIVSTTCANSLEEDLGSSIVGVRFKVDEIDALAAK